MRPACFMSASEAVLSFASVSRFDVAPLSYFPHVHIGLSPVRPCSMRTRVLSSAKVCYDACGFCVAFVGYVPLRLSKALSSILGM
jgi:hypothetical protein